SDPLKLDKGIGRQRVGKFRCKARQDVVDEAAPKTCVGRRTEHRQWIELQDVAREDCIRIAGPALDFRDAHLAWAHVDRRSWLRSLNAKPLRWIYPIARTCPGQPRLLGFENGEQVHALKESRHPHEPA